MSLKYFHSYNFEINWKKHCFGRGSEDALPDVRLQVKPIPFIRSTINTLGAHYNSTLGHMEQSDIEWGLLLGF